MTPKRVLVVDDEPHIVTLLEFLLGRAGYLVEVARNGQEAIERADDFAPDLILLDLMLPVKDGFEVCRTIREGPQGQRPKIILLTARGHDSAVRQGLALGADTYILKPFATAELLAQVRRLLGDSRVG